MTSRQPGLSGWTSANRPTFGEKPGTGSSVDRAIHPTSAKQGRIRCVHDRIDFQLRYIARKEAYPSPRIRARHLPHL
jgi:hypothetical protein